MSRFVAAGASAESAVTAAEVTGYVPPETNDEWATAQIELDEKRRHKEDALSRSEQQSGQSLYETLQANKAAKQEAFEEASKLKHQFRALDDDEIDFLESVNETQRAREAEVRKEETERLKAFRDQREKEADDEGVGHVGDGDEVVWGAAGGRKRKKGKESKDALKGLKVRRTSSTTIKNDVKNVETLYDTQAIVEEGKVDVSMKATAASGATQSPQTAAPAVIPSAIPPAPAAGLGLAAYSSDED